VLSVGLAIVALEFEVFSLALDAVGQSVPRWSSLVFPAMAIVSVLTIIWAHMAGLRRVWLVNVFLRERLRQWRHQLLLDGELMDLARSDPAAYHTRIDYKWSQLCADATIGSGKFDTFIAKGGPDQYFFVEPKMPRDEVVLSQVIRLQAQLRLDYQLSFGETKLSVGGGGKPGIADITKVADWSATTTLVGAVAVSVCLFVSELQRGGHGSHVWFAAAALGLAVLSLGIRAIRTGLTIPGEQESYEEYMNRCQVLAEVFHRDRHDDAARWRVLRDLEQSAAAELRRFLRMKSSSRFIV
jgi:hypothetical protein